MLKTELVSGLPQCTGAPFIEANASAGEGFVTIAFINRTAEAQVIELDMGAHLTEDAPAVYTVLTGKSLEMLNDFAMPDRVAPTESEIVVKPFGDFEIPEYSFSILKIKIN